MNRCVECRGAVSKKDRHICDDCFNKQMQESINADRDTDREVESSHNTWF